MIVFQAQVIHVMQALLNVVDKNCQLHFKVLTGITWDLCKSLCYQLLCLVQAVQKIQVSWSLPKCTIKQSVLHPHINTHPPTITPLTLKDSYMLHLLEKWARPNQVDVVLLLPAMARFPISSQQRWALQRSGVRLHEVPWVRPELGPGIPRWAQEFWCVDRDFFKLHALGLDYEAVIFYDSDAGWTIFWELGGFRRGSFFSESCSWQLCEGGVDILYIPLTSIDDFARPCVWCVGMALYVSDAFLLSLFWIGEGGSDSLILFMNLITFLPSIGWKT